ncbi:MAG TPA: DUF1587 domain-containing protein, partial [Chthoniobacteraceae bacterium]
MSRPAFITLLFAAAAISLAHGSSAGDDGFFQQTIRPLLDDYCLKCHSTDEQKGDLDLEQFSSLRDIGKHPSIWQNVAEHLADAEMPPKGKPQLKPEEKTQLTRWLQGELDRLAFEHAGDPGPVVLRRLSNAEYTYTVRDLTGVDSLDPVREFPADSAAGEGFTNAGQAMVMSPSLLIKYLAAGRDIASHAVLLPDGIRFSTKTTRRDWTDEIVAQIRKFYAGFSEDRGASAVNLQGIQFQTNGGGRLPVEKYLAATLAERNTLADGTKTFATVAAERAINPKYLETLWSILHGKEPSFLLDALRNQWRNAKPEDAKRLATEIEDWQASLWKFNNVGQIGKRGGAKSWQEPVTPLVTTQEVRIKLPKSENGQPIKLYLSAASLGGNDVHDCVIWDHPRLVAPGRPDLPLRDVRRVDSEFATKRAKFLSSAAQCLTAAAEGDAASAAMDIPTLAQRHGIDPESLGAWCEYLGIGLGEAKISTYLTNKIPKSDKYDFIKGWGGGDALSLVANSSDQEVRIPGRMKPHSIAMHPMPTIRAAAGWRSPISGPVSISAQVQRAHPECGTGINWYLEVRRGASRRQLAAGELHGNEEAPIQPVDEIQVQPGDFISLLVGPHNGSHICGLTAVDLTIKEKRDSGREWNLTKDNCQDVLAGNPHPDKYGTENVWHFYSEPDKGGSAAPTVPAGSLLAQWQAAKDSAERQRLADAVQTLLVSTLPKSDASPDAVLYQNLLAYSGNRFARTEVTPSSAKDQKLASDAGLDPDLFGKRADGSAIDPANLCVQTPQTLELTLPSELATGCEFVATARLDSQTSPEGIAQARA